MGLHRKCGRRDEALAAADEALALVESLGLAGSVSAGTTLINAATVCKAFGMAERALPLFARARELYEAHLAPDDRRLGGLYNNMGLALADLERYAEARDCYGRAAAVMDRVPDGQLDKAVTLLNLADLEESERGPLEAEEAVSALLAEAEALIDTPSLPRDGYYAFVCEKCAPVFGHYGWFLAEKKYRDASRRIYERT
jgi:tetratricopeptide (TPR) repeat protein